MKKILLSCSFVALLFSGCVRDLPDEGTQEGQPTVSDSEMAADPVTQVMEVYLSEELCALVEKNLPAGGPLTKAPALEGVFAGSGVISMERIFPDGGEFEERARREGLHRFYRLTYSTAQPVTRASAQLSGIEGIEMATPVRPIKIRSFNDPDLSKQWQYLNTGSMGGNFSKGCDINVQSVWDNYTKGNPSVIVGIVDTGIDYSHPDLAGNYVDGFNFCNNSKVIHPDDHGTHVAGTIAAINNNGIGVCGVAGGDYAAGPKGVGFLCCQIMDGENAGGSGAQAVRWSADHGAVISQNSWGYDFKTDQDRVNAANMGLAKYDPALKAAIDYFIKYAGCDNAGRQRADSPMKGGIYVNAAGNENTTRDVIGEYEPVISVGAVAPNFNRAYYSNYGSWVDICAPGGDAQMGTSTQIYSTKVGTYGYFQGTSMACPHVSGVAALIVSYFGGQGFTAEQLTKKLLGGANSEVMEKVNSRTYIGPLVDALGSMSFGGVLPPAAVAGFTVTPKSNNLDFSWKVTTDQEGIKAHGYLLLAAKDPSLLQNLDPSGALPEGVVSAKVLTEGYKAGQTMPGRISGLEFETVYYTAIAGFSNNNYYSAVTNANGADTGTSAPTSVQTGSNSAPVITVKGESSLTLKAHETGTMSFSVSDPDDHPVTLQFEGGSSAASCKSPDEVIYTITINAPAIDAGSYSAQVTVSDQYGASASKQFNYTVLENHAPVKAREVENILMSRVGEKVTLNMEDYITDPDGETLKYSANLSTTTNLNLVQEGDVIELRATNFGETMVTMKGSDVKGKYCSLSFVVLTRDPSIPIDVYPNPVVDVLTVRPYKETSSAKVTVVSSAGATVFEQSSASSPFDPVKVSMGNLAPGKYVVNVSFDGETHQRTIVKL